MVNDILVPDLEIDIDEDLYHSPEGFGEAFIRVANNYARYVSLVDLMSTSNEDGEPTVLTRNELLVLMYAIAHIESTSAEDFDSLTVSLKKMCSDCGITIKGSTDVRQWKATIAQLFDRKVSFVVKKGVVQTEHYFTGMDQNYNSNVFTFRLNSALKPFFLHLKGYKTIFQFGYFRQLSTNTAMLLYLLCSSMKYGGHTFRMDVEHLKKQLGYTGRQKDFIFRALAPAIYEINQVTDITVQICPLYDNPQQKRFLSAIRFRVEHKGAEMISEMNISPKKFRQKISRPAAADIRNAVLAISLENAKDDVFIKELSIAKLFWNTIHNATA